MDGPQPDVIKKKECHAQKAIAGHLWYLIMDDFVSLVVIWSHQIWKWIWWKLFQLLYGYHLRIQVSRSLMFLTHSHSCKYTLIHKHTHTYILSYIHTLSASCTFACIHDCTHSCTHSHSHTHVFLLTYFCSHTHSPTRILTNPLACSLIQSHTHSPT